MSILKKLALASPPGRRLAARIGALQARIAELESQAKPGPATPPIRVAHAIEVLWRDMHGIYVRGWVHAYGQPVRRIALSSGDARPKLRMHESRPDVLAHFAAYPEAGRSGFRAYIPAAPFGAATLAVETDEGTATLPVMVPPYQRQDPDAPAVSYEPALRRLLAHVRARRGTVVEIGGRRVSPHWRNWADEVAPEGRYIAADVHAAPEVDVVVDAHSLSQAIAPGSVEGVFSLSTLEHLAAPWLVAAEINRVLAPGGLTLHGVPHSHPVHEEPNDFWRFSETGLSLLFGPATGFEVLDRGLSYPVFMPPPLNRRDLDFCEHGFFPGYIEAWILARKLHDIRAGAIAWPTERLAEIGHAYPGPSDTATD